MAGRKVDNPFALGTFLAKRRGAKSFKQGSRGDSIRDRIVENIKAGKSPMGFGGRRKKRSKS